MGLITPHIDTHWHTVWHRSSNLTTINSETNISAFHCISTFLVRMISSWWESWACNEQCCHHLWCQWWRRMMTNGWHIMDQLQSGQCTGIWTVTMSTLLESRTYWTSKTLQGTLLYVQTSQVGFLTNSDIIQCQGPWEVWFIVSWDIGWDLKAVCLWVLLIPDKTDTSRQLTWPSDTSW